MKIQIFIFSLILCFFSGNKIFAYESSAITLSSVTIHWEGEEKKKEQAESLVPLKAGDIISENTLANTLKELQAYPLFESVSIELKEQEPNGYPVVVHLKSVRPIRKISLSGQYPFLAKKILRLLSIQAGDVYNSEIMEENRRRIENFFADRGYYDTKVLFLASDDNKHFSKNIKIKIKKGETYRVKEVAVSGNKYFRSSFIANRLKGFGHFSIKKSKVKIKKLEKRYNKKGYVRAHVRINDTTFNHQNKTVNLNVDVRENKKLLLRFLGNRLFSNQTLQNYTTFSQEQGYSRFDLERSIKELQNFYLLNGFREALITGTLDEAEQEITASFLITEGIRSRVKKITITGNKEFSDKKIIKNMKQEVHSFMRQGFFNQETLEADPLLIENFYLERGYFEVKVNQPTISPNSFGDLLNVKIDLEEGRLYQLHSVSFLGNQEIASSLLHKKIDLRRNFDYVRLEKELKKLETFYLEEGYPHVNINPKVEVNNDIKTVDIIFEITEGPKTRIRKILVIGNHITSNKTIRSTLKFKEGDIYNYKRLLDGQLNLKRLGIFDFVRIDPYGLEEKNPVVDVIVHVVERKKTTVDLQGGFDSDKLGSGQLIMTHRNLFGIGKQFQIKAVGGFEFDRAEATFYSPRLFGASWNLANQYFAQYENRTNFNATTFGASLSTLKPFGNNFNLLLKEQISRFNIDEAKSNKEALKKNLFDNTFSEASASISFDTRNNYADPTRGFYALLLSELDTDLSDPENNFNISQFKISHYFGFLKRFTLINTFRIGKILNVNSNPRIPATKLFFMGGNDTIRGFNEDAIRESGGSTSLIYNVELDFTLFADLKLATFFDAGTLTDTFDEISEETLRDSAGVGLHYMTPIGPIRLDYGFVLDKKSGEDGQRFHFSFGYFF